MQIVLSWTLSLLTADYCQFDRREWRICHTETHTHTHTQNWEILHNVSQKESWKQFICFSSETQKMGGKKKEVLTFTYLDCELIFSLAGLIWQRDVITYWILVTADTGQSSFPCILVSSGLLSAMSPVYRKWSWSSKESRMLPRQLQGGSCKSYRMHTPLMCTWNILWDRPHFRPQIKSQ